MKRIFLIASIVIAVPTPPLKAEGVTGAELKALATKGDKRSERKFQLWNNCKPMHLQVVVNIGAFNRDEHLTNAGIQQMLTGIMSNRLSSAYLYKSDAMPFLQIFVVGGFFDNEYYTQAVYNKVLHDPASGIYRLAPAWRSNKTLGDAGFRSRIVSEIQSHVSSVVDDFMTAYQSVNANACAH